MEWKTPGRGLGVLALVLAGCGGNADPSPPPDAGADPLASRLCSWTDHPKNPLIQPPSPDPMIADPTVLVPAETPDGRWHLFANGLFGLHHYLSDDGLIWEIHKPSHFGPGAVLEPELPWETEHQRRVGTPNLTRREGR